ncbi:MAG: pyruvate kinase [Flavobacteriales bacterium]|nr:pyruvate kinase [Flavobacteriales bacterium]
MKIEKLEQELREILLEMISWEAKIDALLEQVHPSYKLSAKNLLRYLLLRSKDLRKYHGTLSDLGVSSLRSAEGYVYSNLYNVVRNLNLIQNNPIEIQPNIEIVGYTGSIKLIRDHSNSLFREQEQEQFTNIMVTLPDEAAHDKELLREMVINGMNIARINLSHGDQNIWMKMVQFLREIETETGRNIKIYMDLSGPKIRTGQINMEARKGKVKHSINVKKGERVTLIFDDPSARKIKQGKKGQNQKRIPVSLNAVILDAQEGDLILFDDGMIKTRVVHKKKEYLELEILECYKTKLGSHKGINLPDTRLNLPALTAKDKVDLSFVCEHADIVGYSYVRTAADVNHLYEELAQRNAEGIGVIFKIENRESFENLPEILLAGMQRDKIGVMIARGDLAAEIGFERLAEVQNEILWICEAAHIPVVWATQVLENLAKTGIPTRAEISDAAVAAHAECVMLNKGPKIVEAIRVLNDILTRMEGHKFKKKNELRALRVAQLHIDRFREKT